jgi:hypothetical protein
MAKAKSAAASADKVERWKLVTDYVESCNCNFGCPCNFSGYPTDGYCEAIVGYHIRDGYYGRTKLGGIDVVYVAAWPKAIHQGGGTLRLYVSESATEPQREAVVRIFRGLAKGNGPFELFASTMGNHREPGVRADRVRGRRAAQSLPGAGRGRRRDGALREPGLGRRAGRAGEPAEGLHLAERESGEDRRHANPRHRAVELRPRGTERLLRTARIRGPLGRKLRNRRERPARSFDVEPTIANN